MYYTGDVTAQIAPRPCFPHSSQTLSREMLLWQSGQSRRWYCYIDKSPVQICRLSRFPELRLLVHRVITIAVFSLKSITISY